MRATCNHMPRRMVPNGQKHKDGSPQLVCADCVSTWKQRYHRKKSGFAALWDHQHGLCAFCGQLLADDNTTHRDHNHATGDVRGLVHAQCNQMIGGIENAIALVGLDGIARYLVSKVAL
jgi:hypothetical protein